MISWPAKSERDHYDVLVVGGTPAGLACAVTAARGGLSVLVTDRSARLGGMLSGGIGVMDVQYDGRRAAFYDEYCERLLSYYAERYGSESPQYRDTQPCAAWPLRAEPHVAETVLAELLSEQPLIEALLEHVPTSVVRAERSLQGVQFARWDAAGVARETVEITARCYVDATYEGDLFALAGEPYRVGRESRSEYGEPHAGRIFTRREMSPDGTGIWPRAAAAGQIAMRTFKAVSQEVFAGSTGEGDDAVQAYSYRLCLSRDLENRIMPSPPADYDALVYRRLAPHTGIGQPNLPNEKRFWFRNLSGPNWDYPRADEPQRQRIRDIYRRHATGFLYFLQTDESLPDAIRSEAQQWGFARDEFVENDNFPYELYVREARRLVGRYVFTEHDASIAPAIERTPVHEDTIAFADWFMDSHEVSYEAQPGSAHEGKILLTELTRPSQVPFRCMLPQGLDNLVVPLCLSATHVGWGTLRLEPVWMHLGEVAGRAAVLTSPKDEPVAAVDVGALQRELVLAGSAITFFNDVVLDGDPAASSANLLGAHGFFASYDARLGEPLGEAVGLVWARAAAAVIAGENDAMATAARVARAEARREQAGIGLDQLLEIVETCARATGVRVSGDIGTLLSERLPRDLTRGAAARLLAAFIQSGTRA